MNRDEFERRLGTWLEEGADRAPERYVWQALEDVERTGQRRAWVGGIDALLSRLGPAPRVAGVAAALVLLVVASLLVFGRGNVGENQNQPTPRAFEPADLEGIVIWEETMPADWTLDNLSSGDVRDIPVRTMSVERFINLPEMQPYVFGRFTNFSGPDGAFMSWAAIFETAADAEAALPVIANELAAADGWGLGPGEPIVLGEEGLLFTGETRRFVPGEFHDPLRSRIYLWRVGNLLLAVGGFFDYDPVELQRLAEAMDARAH